MHPIVQFLLLLFSLPTLISSSSEANKTLISILSIDLIHRDSPLSPFYNPSLTPSELITNAALRSIISRINGFRNDAEAGIVPNRGDYLMKIFIGTPAMEFLAVADTGSDLFWIPCLPCGLCDQESAFDPRNSSTFMVLLCDSEPCGFLPKQACGDSKECMYSYRYGDQTFSIGDLATESISFGSRTGGHAVSFPETVFGCGRDNQFAASLRAPTGIAGLGGGPLSLVSQLGDQISHKFSYCLLPFSSNSTSKLKFGKEATLSGHGVVSTPLISKTPSTFYYVNLEGVTVGNKTVQTGQSGGNIVIDSGTTLTIQETGFYNDLKAAVREAIGVEPAIDPPSRLDLCFRSAGESGMEEEIPDLVFRFTNADFKEPGNMFAELDNLLCLLVIPNDRISILGNVAQINFRAAFDLPGRKVSFAPADCTKQQNILFNTVG